jgi:hypothetical protein
MKILKLFIVHGFFGNSRITSETEQGLNLSQRQHTMVSETSENSVTFLSNAHDWQKIRLVLILERFPHFLMECVG